MNAARAKATVELNLSGDGQGILDLAGDWRLRRGLPDPETLADSFPESLRRVCVRGKGLEAWDSGLTAFLLALQERLERRGVELDLSEAPEGAARILALARGSAPEEEAPSSAARASLPALLGVKVLRAAETAVDVAAFLGECSLALGRWATGRSRSRATDFFLIMQRSGAEALPIVLLINGLVGMILA
ncbi:MAG: hypothetical protein J7M29_08525, partial [Verrucomicrobia bacterium]|nr:hypothetical protein [Verrucomicrobiota bacterium]